MESYIPLPLTIPTSLSAATVPHSIDSACSELEVLLKTVTPFCHEDEYLMCSQKIQHVIDEALFWRPALSNWTRIRLCHLLEQYRTRFRQRHRNTPVVLHCTIANNEGSPDFAFAFATTKHVYTHFWLNRVWFSFWRENLINKFLVRGKPIETIFDNLQLVEGADKADAFKQLFGTSGGLAARIQIEIDDQFAALHRHIEHLMRDWAQAKIKTSRPADRKEPRKEPRKDRKDGNDHKQERQVDMQTKKKKKKDNKTRKRHSRETLEKRRKSSKFSVN